MQHTKHRHGTRWPGCSWAQRAHHVASRQAVLTPPCPQPWANWAGANSPPGQRAEPPGTPREQPLGNWGKGKRLWPPSPSSSAVTCSVWQSVVADWGKKRCVSLHWTATRCLLVFRWLPLCSRDEGRARAGIPWSTKLHWRIQDIFLLCLCL